MRSLKRKFNNIKKYNPYWSDYVCFFEGIDNQKFSRPIIARWFNQLVDKSEYDKKDRNKLVRQLWQLSNKQKVSEEKDY